MEGHGGLCATIPTGTLMMPWWSAGCWDTHLYWQLMLSMDRVVVMYGCPTWPVLGVSRTSANVYILDGERPLAVTLRMLE